MRTTDSNEKPTTTVNIQDAVISNVSICDVDDCNSPVYSPTEAGDLCEKHYDDYFQALDNASRC